MHIEKNEKLKEISRVFATKAAETNMKIIELLMFKGPLNPYGVKKELHEEHYSVINRRIRALAKSGYVSVVDERPSSKLDLVTKRYGLTLRGFLAALLFINYEKKVDLILNANKQNISFCSFFSEAIEKKTLTSKQVKAIFLDKLKEYFAKGYERLDGTSDYFLFQHAGNYIRHDARALLKKLPKNEAEIMAGILIEFARLAHSETTERFLKPYLTKHSDK